MKVWRAPLFCCAPMARKGNLWRRSSSSVASFLQLMLRQSLSQPGLRAYQNDCDCHDSLIKTALTKEGSCIRPSSVCASREGAQASVGWDIDRAVTWPLLVQGRVLTLPWASSGHGSQTRHRFKFVGPVGSPCRSDLNLEYSGLGASESQGHRHGPARAPAWVGVTWRLTGSEAASESESNIGPDDPALKRWPGRARESITTACTGVSL